MCTKIPAKQATYACYDLTRIQKKFIGNLRSTRTILQIVPLKFSNFSWLLLQKCKCRTNFKGYTQPYGIYFLHKWEQWLLSKYTACMCRNAFSLQREEYQTKIQSKGCQGSTHQHPHHAPSLQLRVNKQDYPSKLAVGHIQVSIGIYMKEKCTVEFFISTHVKSSSVV